MRRAIAAGLKESFARATATLDFNNLLDAAVAGTFLVLVTAIIFVSVCEWILLLSRRKPAVLHETEPVWLPDYAMKEAGPEFSNGGRRSGYRLWPGQRIVRRIAFGARPATRSAL